MMMVSTRTVLLVIRVVLLMDMVANNNLVNLMTRAGDNGNKFGQLVSSNKIDIKVTMEAND